MKACFRPQEAETFLRKLFGHYPAGWIELRSLGTGHRAEIRSFRLPGCLKEGMAEIRHQIADWTDRGRDVYVGVLPRSTETGRGKQDVLALGAYWIDLDRKVAGADVTLLKDCDVVVDTGNGWHGYLVFEPVKLGTDHDRLLREKRIKSWQKGILSGVDSVHDLSRIMRVAGTVNFKAEPKQVVLLRPEPVDNAPLEIAGDIVTARERLGLDRMAPPPDWTEADQDQYEKAWTDGWRTDPRIPDLRALDKVKPWPSIGSALTAQYEWMVRILLRMVARGDRWVDLLDYAQSQKMDERWLEEMLDGFRTDAVRMTAQ
jgi:hypothetical protein